MYVDFYDQTNILPQGTGLSSIPYTGRKLLNEQESNQPRFPYHKFKALGLKPR